MTFVTCPSCGNKVPSTKNVCPHCGYNLTKNANGGALLLVALALAIIFAPIIIVLGLFGKFLLKGLYKNVLEIDEFKNFRKKYSIICLGWFVLSIAFVVICVAIPLTEIVELSFYALCGGNIALFVLSIVLGNKIYKKHKDDIPSNTGEATESAPQEASNEADAEESAENVTEQAPDDNIGAFGSNAYEHKKKTYELLAELAALRDANVLTEEEFNEQKQQILRAHQAPATQSVDKKAAPAVDQKAAPPVDKKTAPVAKPTPSKESKPEPAKKPYRVAIIVCVTVLVVAAIVGVVILTTGHKHNFTSETFEPTCTDYGYTIYVCDCGETRTDRGFDSLGHEIINGACTRCDYTELKYTLSASGDSYIFEGGANTEAVIVPSEYNGLPVTAIGDSAFAYYDKLTSVTLPDSITSIGNEAFKGCESLTEINIPTGVISIGNDAFHGCRSLTSVTIPNRVTSIGDYAFGYCSLTSIALPESVTSIGNGAFSNCLSLTNVIILGEISNIGRYVFSHSPVETATIPASVSKILCDGISNSVGLNTIKEVVITMGDIPSEAFREASSLTTVTFMSGVTSIGYQAFMNCSNLTSVIFEEGSQLTTIENGAFCQCYGLTSISIPASVTTMNGSPFYNCTELTRVEISDLEAWCNISFDSYQGNPLYYAKHLYLNGEEITQLVIPSSVTAIRDYAFIGCVNITDVILHDGVTSIGEWAFDGCEGLINVNIPDSVTSIGAVAFDECYSLTSIVIPKSVTYIGYKAFSTALTIYCEAESQPSDWASDWNFYGNVVWGYEGN